MTYAIVMVHLEAGVGNSGLLQIAGDIANRFEAHVIGVAACQPMPMVCDEGYASFDLMQIDDERIKKEITAVQAEFNAAFAHRSKSAEWRSTTTMAPIADHVAREARSADLIISGVRPSEPADATRGMNLGDLIMQAGLS